MQPTPRINTPAQVIDKILRHILRPPKIGTYQNNRLTLKPQPYKPLTDQDYQDLQNALQQINDTIPKCSDIPTPLRMTA